MSHVSNKIDFTVSLRSNCSNYYYITLILTELRISLKISDIVSNRFDIIVTVKTETDKLFYTAHS